MPGKKKPDRPKIKEGRGEVFFQFILLLSFEFDSRDQRTPVTNRNIKRFHQFAKLVRFGIMQGLKYLDAMSFPKLTWVHQTNVYEVNLRQYTPEGSLIAFIGFKS